MRQVFASTTCVRLPYASVEEHVADYEAHGLAHIELGWAAPPARADLETVFGGRNSRFVLHNYFPQPAESFVLNLASQDGTILERSLAMGRNALRLSAALGAPFYSIHAGFRGEFSAAALGHRLESARIAPLADAMKAFLSSVRQLADLGRTLGVRLLLEPNVVDARNLVDGRNELLLLAEAREITTFLADLAHDNVGILLDTGHLNVSSVTLDFSRDEFIESVGPHIGAFHAHDNDGTADKHRPVARGSWVLDLLGAGRFSSLPVVIESSFATVAELMDYYSWFTREISQQ